MSTPTSTTTTDARAIHARLLEECDGEDYLSLPHGVGEA